MKRSVQQVIKQLGHKAENGGRLRRPDIGVMVYHLYANTRNPERSLSMAAKRAENLGELYVALNLAGEALIPLVDKLQRGRDTVPTFGPSPERTQIQDCDIVSWDHPHVLVTDDWFRFWIAERGAEPGYPDPSLESVLIG